MPVASIIEFEVLVPLFFQDVLIPPSCLNQKEIGLNAVSNKICDMKLWVKGSNK